MFKKIGFLILAAAVVLGGCASVDGEKESSAQVKKGDVILVVGATGKTGRFVVQQLVEQGHSVRAMVRAVARRTLHTHLITDSPQN